MIDWWLETSPESLTPETEQRALELFILMTAYMRGAL